MFIICVVVGEPPRFPSEQQRDIFTFETDVNGNPRDLIIPCNITGNMSGVSYTWFRGSNELPSEMVDKEGNLVIANITEGEFASRDGVSYYCMASKVIGKNSYTASVRSKTITVFYACKFSVNNVVKLMIHMFLSEISSSL